MRYMLKRSINMLLWLQAHIAFNGGVYAGYSRTKRTVNDFEEYVNEKDLAIQGNNIKSQNQSVGNLFLGGSYRTHDFEISLNGFIGSTLLKEEYFKNRFFSGGELSILYYHNDKISFGFLGGLDISHFKSHRYEYYFNNAKDTIFKEDAIAKNIIRGFIGTKLAYNLTEKISIGLKYHCLFARKTNIEEEQFKSENGIPNTPLFSENPYNFINKTKFLTNRILLGVEIKTKGCTL